MSSRSLDWFENIESRSPPWPGLNWLTAMLAVPNVRQAINFYEQALAIIAIFELPNETGEIIFARMRYRGINFTLNQEDSFNYGKSPITTATPPAFIFYLYVDDLEKTYKQALAAGCQLLKEPTIEFWGDKTVRLVDPFGYIWDLACKIN